MSLPDFVTNLPFEAQFFSGPVGRLEDPDQAGKAVALAEENNTQLLSCRLPDPDERSGHLRRAGFRKIEVLLTLGRDVLPEDMPKEIRLAERNVPDAEACARIGRTTFSYDRFHADPEISTSVADQLKEAWVRNAVMGRADAVLVAEVEGQMVGFNACLLKGRTAIIDLIGVSPAVRRQGVGRLLVQAMHAHYHGRADRIQLGTQLANERSLAFYKSLGFKEIGCQQTWHWTPKVG